MRREAEVQNSDRSFEGYSRVVIVVIIIIVIIVIIVTKSRDLGLGPLCSQTSLWWKRSRGIALPLASLRLCPSL